MRTILRVIDSVSEWTGKIARWFWVVVVLVMTYEVIMRYAFTAPTMWAYETSMMIGATTYALAFAYTHRHRAHVRVDVLYTHLSPRGKAIIDVSGFLLFFFPFLSMLIYASVTGLWFSWSIGERLIESYWYPPAYPIRTVMFVGASLFFLQGAAQFTRDFYLLIRNKPL